MKSTSSSMATCLILFGSLLASGVLGQSTTPAPSKNITDYLYNGTTSLLQLERKIPISISLQNVISTTEDAKVTQKLSLPIAKLNFPLAPETTVTGDKKDGNGSTTFTMNLAASEPVTNDNLTANVLEIKLEMIHNTITGYWNVSAIEVTLKGKLSQNCSGSDCDLDLKQQMDVAPKGGYTSRPVDLNCQRDYTMCAPSNLCWTCYDQTVTTKLTANDTTTKRALTVVFPGMRLQPFVFNTTKNFGYRWDCDPNWTSSLWFSLLLSLFLIVILAWAIDMLTTLHTPSKFDDPKGKPLVVPLTE